MKIELIEWYDAHSNTGWESQDAYEINFAVDLTIYSVGHVADESDDRVVLLQSYSSEEPRLYDCSLIIPKGCIVRRTKLYSTEEAKEIEISKDSTKDCCDGRRV